MIYNQKLYASKTNFVRKKQKKIQFTKKSVCKKIRNQKQASVFSASVQTVGPPGFDVAT